mgnify:CR=1 FL=1
MRNQTGSNNNNWKGDDVEYQALHSWVDRHRKRPELCEICNVNPVEDKHNLSGKYTRDIDDWRYVCKKCHRELHKLNKENKKNNKCLNTILQKNKIWKENNPNKIKEYKKGYYQEHKEEILAKAKLDYQNDKDKILIKNKVWRENNPDKVKESKRNWYQKKKLLQ